MREKPPILSKRDLLNLHDWLRETDEECIGCLKLTCITQRDADVEWYREKMQMILDTEYADHVRVDVQQARQATIKEIFQREYRRVTMEKGTIVKLSEKGLDWIYKGSSSWKDRARTYRYEFWGYPRSKSEREYGVVRVKRLTSFSFLSFHKDFIEPAL